LFIPQGAILESEGYVNKLADFAKRATNMNRMPLVLISRADEENQQDIREKMKEKIIKVTGISNDRIFFVDNYCAHKETRKNFNRDKTAYTVLLKCLKLTNYYFDRISTATPKLLESAPVPILTLNYPGKKMCTIPAPTTLQKLQVLTRVVFDIPPQTKKIRNCA